MSERTFNQISNHIDEIIEILNFRQTAQFYFHSCLSRHRRFDFDYNKKSIQIPINLMITFSKYMNKRSRGHFIH